MDDMGGEIDVAAQGESWLGGLRLRHSPAEWNIFRDFPGDVEPMDPWQYFSYEETVGDPPRRRRFWSRQRREISRNSEFSGSLPQVGVGPESPAESWQGVRKTISILGVRSGDILI